MADGLYIIKQASGALPGRLLWLRLRLDVPRETVREGLGERLPEGAQWLPPSLRSPSLCSVEQNVENGPGHIWNPCIMHHATLEMGTPSP